MNRERIFDREEVPGIRGLTSLTQPADQDRVSAIVDVPVIGARGDGKTQFIVHAIRTLRAYAPVLEELEHRLNREVLEVVMNARAPRPQATAPGVVPHYVFRIRPESIAAQVGGFAFLRLLFSQAGLAVGLLVSLINAVAIGSAAMWAGLASPPVVAAAASGLFALGTGLAFWLARRRFARGEEIEIVFWDVAGEHVYADSAADYYTFLSALVRERQRRARPWRSYAFAPVLMCNPISLGVRPEASSYARLRQLIPLIATLAGPRPRVLVAINRWSVVEKICRPGADRKEVVAVVASAGPLLDESVQVASTDAAACEPSAEPAEESGEAAADTARFAPLALPLVMRDVVRRHCLDAEDEREFDVLFSYLRYDAGSQCEFVETPWSSFAELPAGARRRWRSPTRAEQITHTLEYMYEEGPGSFDGAARKEFLGWLAAMAYRGSAAPRDEAADREPWEELEEAERVERVAVGTGSHAAGASAAKSEQGAVVDQSLAAWRPQGRVATETRDRLARIWAGAESDPWTGEGTFPGVGADARAPRIADSDGADSTAEGPNGEPLTPPAENGHLDAPGAPGASERDHQNGDGELEIGYAVEPVRVGAMDEDRDAAALRGGGFRSGT